MERKIYIPVSTIQVYAFCIDDSNPSSNVDNWVEKNRTYELNYSENSILLLDNKGREFCPAPNMRGFNEERFTFFIVFKN